MAAKYIDFPDDTPFPHQRFTDVKYETNEFLLPIDGYQKVDLLPLEDTMKSIEKYIDPDIQEKVYIAKKRCKNPKDGLTQDESASIQIYTMESTNHKESLYYNLNKALRKEDRQQLIPYFAYLKLILTALWKLPSFSGRVWRGVNGDLTKDFREDDTLVWWGFSSCTRYLSVLESDQFLGKEGIRTLFSIECSNGKIIKNHSYFIHEDEVLLLPGIELLVTGKVRPAPGLTIIEVREVTDSPVVLLKPPFLETTTQRIETSSVITTDFDKKFVLNTASSNSVIAMETSKELSKEVKTLVQELKSNNKKFNNGWLKLKIANLSLDDGKAIAEGLAFNKNVDKFSIGSNNISMECLEYMIDSIKTNSRIRGLYFFGAEDGNYLVPVCTRKLVNTLSVNKTIDRLGITRTTVTNNDVKIITDLLKRNTTITEFYLRNNPYLNVQSASYLSELIKTTTTITALAFRGKPNVDDDCAMLISSALKVNSSINDLEMLDSQISDEGAKAYGEMLTKNHTLKNLYLDDNQITDVGAKALANGLKQNSILRFLHIRKNYFTEMSEGGKALMKAKNSKLTIFFD
jgi:hypothetical protein